MILLLHACFDKIFRKGTFLCSRDGKPGEDQFEYAAYSLAGQIAICGQYALLHKVFGDKQPYPVQGRPGSHQLRQDSLAFPLLLDHPLQSPDLALYTP
jgi:hypothetical protein